MIRNIINYLRTFVQALKKFPALVLQKSNGIPFDKTLNDIKSDRILLGKILSAQNKTKSISTLHDVEFGVFSQWGDDGIIQYIIQHTDIPHKTFIEFGVENYRESNTRFLLINDNWSGLVIDGDKKNIDFIKSDVVSWGFDLHSKAAFITKDNINSLIHEFTGKGYSQEIGILSIDIDGNDYWVWKEINQIKPVVVIIEYNSLFGVDKAYTIVYDPEFRRYQADVRMQYYGVSLKAACLLAEQKGYDFIGCNSNGNNAYFIRKDKSGHFKALTAEQGYVRSKFREFKVDGERVSGDARLVALEGKKLMNVESGEIEVFIA
ncbi:MAG TPA: hypothetical protein PK209_12960 [Saprospiraceae bacterium]|nr:hypothetical protein [Saprospiraceae bacterium]